MPVSLPTLFSSLDNKNLTQLESHIKSGAKINTIHRGLTLLDIAIIQDQINAIALLHKYGALNNLSKSELYEKRQAYIESSQVQSQYRIELERTRHNSFECKITVLSATGNEIINQSVFTQTDIIKDKPCFKNNCVLMTHQNEPSILIIDKSNPDHTLAVFKISAEGTLKIVSIDDQSSNFMIRSNTELSVIANVKSSRMELIANKVTIDKKAKIQAKDLVFTKCSIVVQNGLVEAHQLSSTGDEFVNNAVITVAHSLNIDCTSRFLQKGKLNIGKFGLVKSNYIENFQESTIFSEVGEIKLSGTSYMKNDGVIIAKHIRLSSDHMVVNYHGALIKAVSCIIPNRSSQFTNAGFFLVGRQNSSDRVDSAFNYAIGLTKVAETLALIPTSPSKSIQTWLAVSRALYHGAGIVNTIYQGNVSEISSSDIVHFVLDHALPSVGLITNKEDQSNCLIALLYQLWGAYLGEGDYLQQVVVMLETVLRVGKSCSENHLNEANIEILNNVIAKVEFTRNTIKYTKSAKNIATNYYNGNPYANQIAQDTIWAVTESLSRDLLHKYDLPTQIFGLEIEAKNLVFFFLNHGHKQKGIDIFRQGTYSLINTLFIVGKISDEQKVNYLLYAQLACSSKEWKDIWEKRKEGNDVTSDVLKQLFRHVTMLASHAASKKRLEIERQNQIEEEQADVTILESDQLTNESSNEDKEIEEVEAIEDENKIEDAEELENKNQVEQTIIVSESDFNECIKLLQITVSSSSSNADNELEVEGFIKRLMDEQGADYCKQLYQDVYDHNLALEDDSAEHVALSDFSDKVVAIANDKITEELRADFDSDNAKIDVLYNTESIYSTLTQDNTHDNSANAAKTSEVLEDETDVLSFMQQQAVQMYENGVQPKHVDALHEVQRVIDGDYATSGHFGAYSSTFYNHGVLDTVGKTDMLIKQGINYNLIRGTDSISIQGKQPLITELESQIRESFQAEQDTSAFHNQGSGVISSEKNVSVVQFDKIDNHGAVSAKEDAILIANKSATNYEQATISGKNVYLEGRDTSASNAGAIFAQDTATIASRVGVNHDEKGIIAAKRIDFKSPNVKKAGSINAILTTVGGYDAEQADNVDWRRADDHIYMVSIKSQKAPDFDAEAFNDIEITDLQINNPDYDLGQLKVDKSFDKILQVQLPQADTDRNISVESLPQFDGNSTFILSAPGATLDATQEKSGDQFSYNNSLHFSGKTFQHSGTNTFEQGWFDVQKFEDTSDDGSSHLELKDGGVIQAKKFSNQSSVHSDGTIHWHVEDVTNDAQTKMELNKYEHSNQEKICDFNPDEILVPESGTIHAKGHTGYIGQYHSIGGALTSGKDGNLLYMDNAELKPLLTSQGTYVLGYVLPKGMSWYVKPTWENASIGSSGRNVILGKGKLESTGADIYGDEGCLVSFNQGIDDDGYEAAFYSIQKGKNSHGHVIVPVSDGYILSQSSISSNDGQVILSSADDSIRLRNTILSTPSDAILAAKQDVTINGQETVSHELLRSKKRGLFHTSSISSDTTRVTVLGSSLFVGGQLKVNCLEFQMGAVDGVIGGADITALTTTLEGKQQNSSNKTVTKSFAISLPAQNLINVLSSHNAKAIFSTIVQSCGWDQAELEALANADSITEIPAPLLNTAVNTWNLTVLAAKATNEWFDNGTVKGSVGDFVGSITDKLGLTSSSGGKRTINTKINFDWSKTTETTEESSVVASNLYIAGTFKLFGNKLVISDGSQIDAKDLLLSLAKGIEMTKGTDTYHYTRKTKEYGVGINALNPKDVSVSAGRDTSKIHHEESTLAGLHARETADIRCGESIIGEGRITAKSGNVKAPTVSLESVQDVHSESHKSDNISLSTNFASPDILEGSSASINHSRSNSYKTTTQKSEIIFDEGHGKVTANRIHLGQGAVIDAERVVRADNEDGNPDITGTIAVDQNQSSHNSFSINASSISSQPGGQINRSNSQETTVHQPSVYGLSAPIEGINTDRSQESAVIQSKKTKIAVSGFVPNKDKIQSEATEIKHAAETILDKGEQALHFMFRPGQNSGTSLPAKPHNLESNIIDSIGGTLEADRETELEQTKTDKGEKDTSSAELNTDDLSGLREQLINEAYKTPESAAQLDALLSPDNEHALGHSEAEKEGDVDSELNGGFSAIPGLSSLQALPGAALYLTGLSTEQIYRLAGIQDDFQNGRFNSELAALQQAESNKGSNLASDILNVFNPINTAHAGVLDVFSSSEVALLRATGAILSGPRNVLEDTSLYSDEAVDGKRPSREDYTGRPSRMERILDEGIGGGSHTGHAPEDMTWIGETGGFNGGRVEPLVDTGGNVPEDLSWTGKLEGYTGERPEPLIHTGHSDEGMVPPIFIMYRENGEERIYDDDYAKHKPTSSGNARWGTGKGKNEVSINPIPTPEEAAELLKSADAIPGKESCAAPWNGKAIIFRSSRDGRYHCYEEQDADNKVGDKILKKWLAEDRISKKEYKKLIKGKA